jgi:hypothetical protein
MKLLSSLPFGAALAAALVGIAPASAQQVVPVGPFDSIELEGGGHVIVKAGDVQQVRLLQGSTALTRFRIEDSRKLKIEACNNDCPHHYNLEVEITTPHLDALAISGGGRIESTGKFPATRHLAVAVEGGGTIDARSVDADNAEAAVNGGGVIKLKAHGNLTAAVDGGGDIRYWGNPRVTQAIEGGGRVERGE